MLNLRKIYSVGMFFSWRLSEVLERAREHAADLGMPVDVYQLTIPKPSMALVLNILNDKGYVTGRTMIQTVHPMPRS